MPSPDGDDEGKGGRGHKTTRLEACKSELIRALGRLSKDVEFNVIWFNQSAHLLSKAQIKATPTNVKKAQAWVRKLTPNGSTNIHDSLQLSFSIKDFGKKVRRSSKKRRKNKYDVGVAMGFDTIFLLSDGSPTKPPGDKPDSTKKILAGVRVWNPLKRVTIHCIGIGRGVNRDFMEQLAQENGGQFKHFLE